MVRLKVQVPDRDLRRGVHVQGWVMPDQEFLDRSKRWREVSTQFALVFGAAIFYFLVRGITQGGVERANENAEAVLRLERSLRLDIETWAQELILDHRVLVTLSNWVYIWGHWPVIIVTLYSLHRWRPTDYLRLRNALFVSGAIGIVIYATFPVAPPRLLDPIYQDTVTDLSTSYRVFQPPALVNKYAAMPSLHAGWNLLAGVVLYGALRGRVMRSVAVVGPIAMALAVVLTANHYVLDVVAGGVVALTGLVLSLWWWPHPAYTAEVDATGSPDLDEPVGPDALEPQAAVASPDRAPPNRVSAMQDRSTRARNGPISSGS